MQISVNQNGDGFTLKLGEVTHELQPHQISQLDIELKRCVCKVCGTTGPTEFGYCPECKKQFLGWMEVET